MALKKINNQYTNTDNIVKTYSVGGRYFVAFKGGIEIELKGANAATEYATLSAYFDKTRTGEYVNKNIIYKTYQVGTSPNYKYFLEFTNGQKIEIQANEYNAIISDGGESPIDPQSLDNSISAGTGIVGDVAQGGDKYEIHLDMTGAAAGKVLKVDSAGTGVEWGEAGGGGGSQTIVAGSGINVQSVTGQTSAFAVGDSVSNIYFNPTVNIDTFLSSLEYEEEEYALMSYAEGGFLYALDYSGEVEIPDTYVLLIGETFVYSTKAFEIEGEFSVAKGWQNLDALNGVGIGVTVTVSSTSQGASWNGIWASKTPMASASIISQNGNVNTDKIQSVTLYEGDPVEFAEYDDDDEMWKLHNCRVNGGDIIASNPSMHDGECLKVYSDSSTAEWATPLSIYTYTAGPSASVATKVISIINGADSIQSGVVQVGDSISGDRMDISHIADPGDYDSSNRIMCESLTSDTFKSARIRVNPNQSPYIYRERLMTSTASGNSFDSTQAGVTSITITYWNYKEI